MNKLLISLVLALLFFAAAYSVANADPVQVMTNQSTSLTYTHPDWKYTRASVQVTFSGATSGAVDIKASVNGTNYVVLKTYSSATGGVYTFDTAAMYKNVQVCHRRKDVTGRAEKSNVWLFGE